MRTSEATVGDAREMTKASDDELELIRSTAARVFAEGGGGLPDLGAMGWLGLLTALEVGGSGWLPVEAAVVAREAGKAREANGWASATLGAGAVAAALDDQVRARWAAGALDGTAPVRWMGPGATTFDPEVRSVTSAAPTAHVVGTAEVAAFVLAADDGQLLLVPADQDGVVVDEDPHELDTRGGLRQVRFDSAAAVVVPLPDDAQQPLRGAALLLGASAAAGPLAGAVARLVAYLSERVAFDAPIASFQAIQHRLVDLYVVQRRFEAVLESAARRLEVGAPDALRAACVAHAYVADRIVPALDECIQLSGGIGFVWEYPLHHELRGALTDANQFGTARSSRTLLAQIDGW